MQWEFSIVGQLSGVMQFEERYDASDSNYMFVRQNWNWIQVFLRGYTQNPKIKLQS